MGIGVRLKGERARLGKSQGDLATSLRIAKKSQTNCELGHSQPAADYSAAAAMRIDVPYVLIGIACDAATNDERQLLRGYRSASAELRSAALAVLRLAVVRKQQQPSQVIAGGEHGQVVQRIEKQFKPTFNVSKKGRPT